MRDYNDIGLFGEFVWLISMIGFILSAELFRFYLLYVFFILTFLIGGLLAMLSCRDLGWFRLGMLLFTGFCMYVVYPSLLDLPAYLKHDYAKAEGRPYFEYSKEGKSPVWVVYLGGQKFGDLNVADTDLLSKWAVVSYLPHGKFVIDYKFYREEP